MQKPLKACGGRENTKSTKIFRTGKQNITYFSDHEPHHQISQPYIQKTKPELKYSLISSTP